jgi:hypothetical protein
MLLPISQIDMIPLKKRGFNNEPPKSGKSFGKRHGWEGHAF